jgi:peptidyl-Asp metalloendopeptidase
MKYLASSFRTGLWLVVFLSLGSPVFAQAVPFQLQTGDDVAPGPRGLRATTFTPNLDAIRSGADEIYIVLPGGDSVIVERTRFEDRGDGDALWAGRVILEQGSSVLITLKKGVVVGFIQRAQDDFTIGTRGGVQIIERINRAAPKGDSSVATPADPATTASVQAAPPLLAAADVPADSEIDVLVLYTPQARDALGGVPQMEAAIQNAIDYSNTVFVNSNVAAHYRLVHTKLSTDISVFFNDPDNDASNLDRLTTNPGVATLRNETGADLVALILSSVHIDVFGCAVAHSHNVETTPQLSFTVQETGLNCAPLAESFAHENGHLLGMNHDPANALGQTQYPWSFGHQVSGVFHTIMSYGPCAVTCPNIPNFSNPDISYLGFPTGVADQRDNARTGRINAPIVAAFRPPAPPAIPGVPAGLNAVFSSGAGVQLVWFPEPYATAYDVQRSLDNSTFVAIGTVSTSQFVDPNVSSPNTYYYRVRARNFRGASAYSAVKTFVMPLVPAAPSGLTATALGANEARLDWTDNAVNEIGFVVEMLVNGAFEIVDGSDGVNVKSYTLRWLAPSTKYTFRVLAYSDDFESGPSNAVSVTTLATNPGSITGYAFNDPNHNNVPDKGETPAAGLVIFYDANGNGVNDESPQTAVTVSSAVKNLPGTNIPYLSAPNYTLGSLPLGSKRICASFYPSVAGRAFCRNVTVAGATPVQNVNFPVVDGRVGVASMTPSVSAVRVGHKVTFDITWTDTDGRWVLLKDATIRFAESDRNDAMQIVFNEASRTFGIFKGTRFEGGFAAGTDVDLDTHEAILYLKDSQVLGTGPAGSSVTLRLVMAFKPPARGDTYAVQIKLTDDNGYVQGFDTLGRVTVLPEKHH